MKESISELKARHQREKAEALASLSDEEIKAGN